MQILQPMKPAKIDLEKPSHQKRLDEWFEDPAYVAEPKIDGCHYFNQAGQFLSTKVSKRTGNLVDKTENFPHLVEGFLRADLGQTVLDGEIYYPNDHKSYGATKVTGCLGPEAVRRQEQEGWIHYCIFDVLRDPDGNWLFNLPWYKRRELMEQIGAELSKHCEYYEVVPVKRNRKRQFLEKVLNQGGEGIVLKYTKSIYVPGKRPINNWIKIKTGIEDDVVILGFDPPERLYTGKDFETWPYWENGEPVTRSYYNGWIGSIAFGKYDDEGQLIFLGSCTGITDSMREEFTNNQNEYIGQVMQIKAMEYTEDGRYRHPNFVRIHPDKNPHECVITHKGGEGAVV